MARGRVHTVYRNGLWYTEIEGEGILASHRTKSDTINCGRVEASYRHSEHLTHDLEGQVVERRSFRRDVSGAPR